MSRRMFAFVVAISCLLTIRVFSNRVGSLSDTVYITDYGDHYHTRTCGSLWKSCWPISLEDAYLYGHDTCKRCSPPILSAADQARALNNQPFSNIEPFKNETPSSSGITSKSASSSAITASDKITSPSKEYDISDEEFAEILTTLGFLSLVGAGIVFLPLHKGETKASTSNQKYSFNPILIPPTHLWTINLSTFLSALETTAKEPPETRGLVACFCLMKFTLTDIAQSFLMPKGIIIGEDFQPCFLDGSRDESLSTEALSEVYWYKRYNAYLEEFEKLGVDIKKFVAPNNERRKP